MPSPLILIAEDDERFRAALAIRFTHVGYRVIEAADGDTAIALARQENPDLLILDVHMPNTDGLTTLDSIDEHDDLHGKPVIYVTGDTSAQTESAATRRGAFWVFHKPVNMDELLELAEHLIGPAMESAA